MNQKRKKLVEAYCFALLTYIVTGIVFADIYNYTPTSLHPKISILSLFFAGAFYWLISNLCKGIVWMFTD